jgi:Holliday junction resolvase
LRLRAKVDNNHREIAEAFRKHGWLVLSLAPVGRGVPDLLVSKHGHMRLVEVKQKRGKLTEQQVEFMKAGWHFDVVRDVADVRILTMALREQR